MSTVWTLIPVCLQWTWRLVGILNALSNGKLNQLLVNGFLIKVVHVYMGVKMMSVGFPRER